ncbi:TonB-dependent siderophore receptor [Acidovorax sp. SDU_ACID1]|uniref:TonB-dependent siderophore receptor n=1 Tax=Acidovorax sp. SDU_ACID1 TaxID=3136632 RepID=UPI0038735C5A
MTVIGAEEMETRNTRDLSEVLNYTAGVIPRTEAADRTGDGFIIRGFEAAAGSIYRDGMPLTVNFYDGQQEPYGLERVEVLKGAASLLYGATAPGGIVNLVTKRPTRTPLRELNVEYGSFDRKQVSGDFGGPIGGSDTEPSAWSYRATFLKRESDAFVDHVPDDRDFFAGALRWQPSAATSLTIRAEYLNRDTIYVNGLPAEGTVWPNPNGKIARSYFPGIPGWNRYDSTSRSVGYDFEHAFNATLKLRHVGNYTKTKTAMYDGGPTGLSADQSSGQRNFALSRDDASRRLTTSTYLEAKFDTGPAAHTLLAGVDTSNSRWGTDFFNYDVTGGAPQSYFDPAYDLSVDRSTARRNYYYDDTRQESVGMYLQDQVKINDRLVLLGGLRHERFRTRTTPQDGVTPPTRESVSANTGRLGVVYLFDNGVAPFASYSQSYQPEAGKDRLGNSFKPTEGEQFEVGVRWQPKGSDTLLSAALYQLTRTNITVPDPLDWTAYAQIGEVRARGLELEARAAVTRNTRVIANYTYTSAETTKTSPWTPELAGQRNGGVPKHAASLWVDHDFGSLGLPELRVGAGVRYIGETPALFRNDLTVASYTLVDAMASYTYGPWRFAVNANNLFDKNYATCTYNCFYGEERRIVGSVSYRW